MHVCGMLYRKAKEEGERVCVCVSREETIRARSIKFDIHNPFISSFSLSFFLSAGCCQWPRINPAASNPAQQGLSKA